MPISRPVRKIEEPPSWVMATSKESRVRRLGLWKMRASERWSSSWCARPALRSALSRAAVRKRRSTSGRVRSAKDKRSRFVIPSAPGWGPWGEFPSRARMGARVSRLEPAAGHVRVDLGGAEVLVSQELLDRAEVRAPVQQMRGEAVPEGVRVRGRVGAERSQEGADVALQRPRRD